MKWTEVPAGDLNAAEQRMRVAFGDNADAVVTRINTDPAFAPNIAGLMAKDGIEPTVSQQRAREIMGANFFGVEEAVCHLRVKPRRFEILGFGEVAAADEELEAVRETHILAAVFPTSLLQVREGAKKGTFVSYEDAWYNKQAFAARNGRPGWRLVRKTAVPNSTSLTWNDQQKLLPPCDETPTARVAVYVMAGHYLATREKIFSDVWVRCSDVASDGDRVVVGFYRDGVLVDRWSVRPRGLIGLASARKSE